MRHQLANRDRLAEGIVGMKVRQISRHGRVEVDLALLDELHYRDIGEELRHRADAIHGLRSRAAPRRRIDDAESLRPDHLLVVDERDRDDRQSLRPHLALDEPLELVGDGGVISARCSSVLRCGA